MQIFYDIENFVQNRMKSCGNKDVSAYRHCFVCRIVQCGERDSFIENIFGPDSEVGLLLIENVQRDFSKKRNYCIIDCDECCIS